MKIIILVALLALNFTGFGVTNASKNLENQTLHFYVGAGVGGLYHTPNISNIPDYKSPMMAYRLFAGYSWTPNWAVQLGYIKMQTFTQQQSILNVGDKPVLLKPYVRFNNDYLTLSALYSHYLTSKLAVTGEVGMALSRQNVTQSALSVQSADIIDNKIVYTYGISSATRGGEFFTPLLGAKASYFWTKHISSSIVVRYLFARTMSVQIYHTTFSGHVDSSLFYDATVAYHF